MQSTTDFPFLTLSAGSSLCESWGMEAATLRLVFALVFRCVGMGKAEVMPVETMTSVARLPDVACGNGLADGTCALGG